MDLATALNEVTTLSKDRKNELLERYQAGTLTEEDTSELAEHLAMAAIRFENLAEREEAVVKTLTR